MVMPSETVALFVTLLVCLGATARGSFPGPYGGCPAAPTPIPLPTDDDGNDRLPTSVAEALRQADIAASLIQSKGISPVESGLWTTPTASISVGVVYDQELIWSRGYGLRNRTDPTSVPDADSEYRIGSISKIFAMLATMVTRDAGKLSLDEGVSELRIRPAAGSRTRRPVTFANLLTHMGGVTRETPCSPPSCAMDNAEAFARIANTTAILPPDVLPIYSNCGFDVCGQAVAARNGLAYEEMIQKLIIDPLGLAHTGVNITEADPNHLAYPYLEKDVPCPAAKCLNDFGWSNPSGAMYSSVADLAEVAKLMFRDDARAGETKGQILDGTSLRETLLPRYIAPDREGGYALTWELYRVGEYMIRTKRGDVQGYASELILVPELKLGIVVLASVVEHAQATAQTLTGLLLPAFDSWLRSSQAPPLTASTGHGSGMTTLDSFAGEYQPHVWGPNLDPSELPTLHVTKRSTSLSSRDGRGDDGVLLFDWIDSVLQYVGEESVTTSEEPHHIDMTMAANRTTVTFRMMPWPGIGSGPAARTCTETQSDDWHELVKFDVVGDDVRSLRLDFVYGVDWVKQ